jgi:hypothetical protein
MPAVQVGRADRGSWKPPPQLEPICGDAGLSLCCGMVSGRDEEME